MINSNVAIGLFLRDNWALIAAVCLLIIGSTWKVVPYKWCFSVSDDEPRQNFTPIHFVINNALTTFVQPFIIHFLTAFGLKNMVSLLIFVVVVFDVFVRHQISTQAVAMITVGIIALYMDKLVDTGKTIKFLGGLFAWERKE